MMLLKRSAFDVAVHNTDSVDSITWKFLTKKDTEVVNNKIPDTSKFAQTQEFNRLTKINYNAIMLSKWWLTKLFTISTVFLGIFKYLVVLLIKP